MGLIKSGGQLIVIKKGEKGGQGGCGGEMCEVTKVDANTKIGLAKRQSDRERER
jgi:hypothetical protein